MTAFEAVLKDLLGEQYLRTILSVAIILLITIIFSFIVKSGNFLKKHELLIKVKAKIEMPEKTLTIEEIDIGEPIIILNNSDSKLPIAQYVKDYQEGMSTKNFKKTFRLDCPSHKVEFDKTYVVERDESSNSLLLKQIAMFITSDTMFG